MEEKEILKDEIPVSLAGKGSIRKFMTGQEIENIISIICLVGWIPILAIFSGIAKVISVFKGNYTGGNGVNIALKHNSDDYDEEDE